MTACTAAITERVPHRLSKTQRDRIQSTISDALNRVRTRSRGEILADALSQALGREVIANDIGRIDHARGRYTHQGAERDTQPAGQDEQLLEQVARALLRRAIDAHL
jgi:hypothetical protein